MCVCVCVYVGVYVYVFVNVCVCVYFTSLTLPSLHYCNTFHMYDGEWREELMEGQGVYIHGYSGSSSTAHWSAGDV